MFTRAERDRVRERLLELARADQRIVGAALTGSLAGGAADEWSDVDLAFALADGVDLDGILRDWTWRLYDELHAVHHWELPFRGSVYRVFLLPSGLELDVAFVPRAEFGPRGPGFRVVFGEAGEEREGADADPGHLVGLVWHHLLHARAGIERDRPWLAEFYLGAARDHVLELACLRHGESADYGRGFDRLPSSVIDPLEAALVGSLQPEELRRALAAVTAAYLVEVAELDSELGAAVERALQ